jgi:hypothetical protein
LHVISSGEPCPFSILIIGLDFASGPNSILHQRKFFDNVTPVNFNTIATPHIGILLYPSLLSRLASVIGPRLLGRTGEQFYAVDKWSKTGKPLLEVMTDPGKGIFHSPILAC